jgi:PD-(D/E)XK nuclease superfamily
MKMSIAASLSKSGFKPPKQVVWDGPESDTGNGGCSQSLIQNYLSCKERFRLYAIKGLKAADRFNHHLEYGNLFHCAAENFLKPKIAGQIDPSWLFHLRSYCLELCNKYPLDGEQIDKWFRTCCVQFPLYIEHWNKHQGNVKRTPLLREEKFKVPYQLPSGRTVWLRGKWDAFDFVETQVINGRKVPAGLWLTDHKTKGDIDEHQIQRQLTFDIQLMFYMVALDEWIGHDEFHLDETHSCNDIWNGKLQGAVLNVVRRPLSGGKGTIVMHKATAKKPAETKDQFYRRVAEYIEEEPEHYFMRWTVEITRQDVERFQREFLDPCLENLCDDYEWWSWCIHEGRQLKTEVATITVKERDVWNGEQRKNRFPHHCPRHYRQPFGCWDPLEEGGSSELDHFLNTGSDAGLTRVETMFPELA